MKNPTLAAALTLLLLVSCSQDVRTRKSELRAPSYPLVTIDPFTSAWSPADELYGATVEHWTGHAFPLLGVICVDGVDYRFLGKEKSEDFKAVAAAGREHPWDGGAYTLKRPAAGWAAPEFKTDASWIRGQGAFGSARRRPMTNTCFETGELWVRREITLPEGVDPESLYIQTTHKGSAEYFINGIPVAGIEENDESEFYPIPKDAIESLRDGKVVLAGHSAGGPGSYIDMGLYRHRIFEERYPLAAMQTSAQVQAMNTIYSFECGPVILDLRFTAPLFLENYNLISRPVNYISYAVRATDGQKHDISLRLEAGAEWALDYATDEHAVSETFSRNGLIYGKTGNKVQDVLWKSGDGTRIDWGYFLLAAEEKGTAMEALPDGDLSLTREIGKVAKAKGKFLVGYDDLYSIQYFGENLRPWWNRNGDRRIEDEFDAALKDYPKLMWESAKFDAELMDRAARAGGQKYAEICALAYRQAIHAHKLVVLPNGEIGFFSKENNSNGSIGTVDVTYPSVPLFFLYNRELVKGMMNFIFDYSESGRWAKDFPAHDVGQYPRANGQFYGSDMPVEESGNMLVLAAAVCRYDGNADYVSGHWDMLTRWAEYLEKFGLDPEDQLCTDDFAGPSAHNVNLSAKAIMGIASYAYMAQMRGENAKAEEYFAKARTMAGEWMVMADDGDHYRLTFDRSGSWSQKYNIVWDKLIGLDIFPKEVMRKEIAWYLGRQNVYGLPLDSRESYTKPDWITWTATMAENPEDFEALIAPIYKFYNESLDRDPMGDWFWTGKPYRVGFKARSVVGAFFIKLLNDEK